jgi:hypothetical protein
MVGIFKSKKPPGRPRQRWNNNIKLYLNRQFEALEWVHLAGNKVQ